MSIIKPSTKWPLIFELNFELNPHLEAGSLKECVKHEAENDFEHDLTVNASAATHVSGTTFGSNTDDLYQVGMHSVNSHGMI